MVTKYLGGMLSRVKYGHIYIVHIVYYMKYPSLSVDERFSHMAIFIHYDV